MKNFLCGSFELINLFSRLFLTLIDFSLAWVIQGLLLNFNLYLLTCFNDARSSRIEFMLSKNELMERFTSC